MNIEADSLKAKAIAVIGKRGSGKTNTLFHLSRQWLDAGNTATFIDPMGQFRALRNDYPMIVVGHRDGSDIELTPDNAAMLAKFVAAERISVVLDLSLVRGQPAREIVEQYLNALWDGLFTALVPQPYALVIDEAHLYAPQETASPTRELMVDMAKLGRHKLLTTIYATQRAASIDKNVLTQSDLLIAHRLTFGVDTAVLREQLPLPAKDLNAMMRQLATGEAVMIGDPAFTGDEDSLRVQIPYAIIPTTPDGRYVLPRPTVAVDEALVSRLREMLKAEVQSQDVADADRDALLDEIRSLREERDALRQQVTDLEAETHTLRHELADKANALKAQLDRMVFQPKVDAPVQPAVADDDQPYRSPVALNRAIKKQEAAFLAVLGDIRKLPKHNGVILRYVLQRDGQRFTVRELARFTGYSESNIVANPPTMLIQMGWLGRDGNKRQNYRYYSKVESVLQRDYPDLDADALIDKLLLHLPV